MSPVPTPTPTCAVCGEHKPWRWYHNRLDAYICTDCPLTDVNGEDVTAHAMLWNRANPGSPA